MDAIILAGGRSSRLGGVPKAELVVQRQSLLRRTLAAVVGARTVVVVGGVDPGALPDGILVTRENPPFGGPAAAIAAGAALLAAVRPEPSELTLVLACDMPGIGAAVPALVESVARHPDADGVMAVDFGGRSQPLAAIYRTHTLALTLMERQESGPVAGMPVFALIAGMRMLQVPVPSGSTDDVDTWTDAETFGIERPEPNRKE